MIKGSLAGKDKEMELRVGDHWTNDSEEDLQFHIANEFLMRVEIELKRKGITRKEFAKLYGVSEGWANQILGKPGNLTIKRMIRIAKVVGLKPAVVLYETSGLTVPSMLFERSWEHLGCPANFWQIGGEE